MAYQLQTLIEGFNMTYSQITSTAESTGPIITETDAQVFYSYDGKLMLSGPFEYEFARSRGASIIARSMVLPDQRGLYREIHRGYFGSDLRVGKARYSWTVISLIGDQLGIYIIDSKSNLNATNVVLATNSLPKRADYPAWLNIDPRTINSYLGSLLCKMISL